jgi:hypothetical protein
MRKLALYTKLCWLFFISLFVPTATIGPKVDALMAEINGEPAPDAPPSDASP